MRWTLLSLNRLALYETIATVQPERLISVSTQKKVYLFDGLLAFSGPSLRSDPHVHYFASLYIGEGVRVELEDGRCLQGDCILVGPNTTQAFDACGQPFLDLLMDPESIYFDMVSEQLGKADAVVLDGQALQPHQDRLKLISHGEADCAEALDILRQAISLLGNSLPAKCPKDSRITEIARRLSVELPTDPPTSELAAQCDLSTSRFMALFKAQMGLPVSQYILWHRLLLAARLTQDNQNFTDVAANSGFYDQAHFSRTVRRMFGTSATAMYGQIYYCFD